jgi:hypothetical protein
VVDQELKDLEKTLKNIEEARPFEDLTVVGVYSLMKMAEFWDELGRPRTSMADDSNRTISLPRNLKLTSELLNWSPKDDGEYLDTA